MNTMNQRGIEIERKFLIKYPDLQVLEKLGTRTEIEQTYLKSENGSRRVRKASERGIPTYFYCEKQDINSRRRTEEEYLITEDNYINLLKEAQTGTLKKTRYRVPYLQLSFEIDVYPFWKDRAILEVELSFENEEIQFPPYITLIGEVTDDFSYRNVSLAKIFTTLPQA